MSTHFKTLENTAISMTLPTAYHVDIAIVNKNCDGKKTCELFL